MDLSGVSLDDLALFLAICQCEGFRDAGRKLGLAPSTVSERIQRLEQRLGVRLLVRTTRSVTPTPIGRQLAARLAPLFTATGEALQDAINSGDEVRGTLTLNVPGAVMIDILPPLVERFLTLHPEVRVEIMVEDRFVDAFAAGADAGIRYGERMAQDMIAVPIGPATQQGAIVASPAYLDAHGRPTAPDELLSHRWIRSRFASGRLTEIELERGDQLVTLEPEARLIISTASVHAALHAACAGLGCVMTFRNWLDPYIARGELEPVLQDWWPTFEGPQLYFPSRRYMPAPLRAFLDMVAAHRAAETSA